VQQSVACKKKKALTDRYPADRHTYIENVRRLEGVSGADFETAYLRAERARIAFEESRVTLNEHLAEHGCKEPHV